MPGERLFISDCHLSVERPRITQALIDFLQARASRASQLYILGDLFEVWLGDDDPAPGMQPIIDALSRIAASCELYFMAGNRDFLVGERFASSVGLTLLQEPYQLQLGNSRVVLVHGDTLCTDDHDYQAFRRQVRDPAWQAEFLAKSVQERRQIAAGLRRESATAMSQKSSEIMDVNQLAVADCFRENNADVIIHGHTHRPALHRYPENLSRIVLGDWVTEASFLSWEDEQGFNLCDPRV